MPVPASAGRKSIHQPFAVGFQTGAKRLSVIDRSSSGPWISGSGAIDRMNGARRLSHC